MVCVYTESATSEINETGTTSSKITLKFVGIFSVFACICSPWGYFCLLFPLNLLQYQLHPLTLLYRYMHNVLFMLFSLYILTCFKMNKFKRITIYIFSFAVRFANVNFHRVIFFYLVVILPGVTVLKLIWPRCQKPQVYFSACKIERIT